jgi:hypothetical protein
MKDTGVQMGAQHDFGELGQPAGTRNLLQLVVRNGSLTLGMPRPSEVKFGEKPH